MMRILLLADTHLGLDYPVQTNLKPRHRGPDFFANFERTLEIARTGQVDCVVHAGDLLFRSRVKPGLVEMALRPLKEVASLGVPVYLVPGNHERSEIPFGLLASHPGLFVFSRPRTFVQEVEGRRVALSGFPFQRNAVRLRFPELLGETGWTDTRADVHFLCIHQCVEGARVGPYGYTFRTGEDVVRAADIMPGWTAVLAGHIHRSQVLTRELTGVRLPCPVFYPGSIERTSFAELSEEKGFFIIDVDLSKPSPGLAGWTFRKLPTRSMVRLECDLKSVDRGAFENWLIGRLTRIPRDSIVQLRLRGSSSWSQEVLRVANLRKFVPESMVLSVHRATG